SVKGLIALIRANPGKYSYASGGGIGSAGHLVGEQFRLSQALDLVHVPYNGANLAIAATVAGHTPICFAAPTPAVPLIRQGDIRALAGTGDKRLQALPDVQTMAEAGYPDIECDTWFGVFAPAGTPKEIVELLNREIVRMVVSPDMKQHLAELAFYPVGSSPASLATQLRTDTEKWRRVIRAANIQL